MAFGVDYLIGAGHTYSEVRKYTLRQLYNFVKLSQQRRREEMMGSALSTRAAQHCEPKEFKAFLKALGESDG